MEPRPVTTLLAAALLLALPPVRAAADPGLEAAQAAAEAATRAGDYRGASRLYREILADLERWPAGAATDEAWTRALLKLAVAEATLGNGQSSRGAMERVLAFDPAASPDPDTFSPAFRKEFEAARARVASRPRFLLRLAARSGTGQGAVDGRPAGALPLEILLPAGTWRVAVESSGATRATNIDLFRDESVVVDVAAPPPALAASPPPPAASIAVEPPGTWMRPAAWTSAGLAAAAAGIATWQGIAAAGSRSEAAAMLLPDGSLRPGVDPAAYASAASAFAAERRNAWIAAGSAAALGAGAAVLFLLAPATGVEPAPGGIAFRF
jgi:hypothetical protein